MIFGGECVVGFWDVLGYLLAILGILATFVAYVLGKAAGREETDRATRLDSLSSLRREIEEARQHFNDWFAPLMVSSGSMADPALSEEVGKKVDAIKITFRAVRVHLKQEQRDATEELLRRFGEDYLQFSFACKRNYANKQREIAVSMQDWFAGSLQDTLNEVLTENPLEIRSWWRRVFGR